MSTKTWKLIGVLIAVSLIIDYWYIVLTLAAIGGACYWWNERRKQRQAKHAACEAEIERLEKELGIGVKA